MSTIFYWAVVQAVLIFGAETWVLSEAMSQNLEGVQVGLINQIMGQREVRQNYSTWRCVAAYKVLKKSETQSLGAYIDRWQETVADRVELRPILEVCDKETG